MGSSSVFKFVMVALNLPTVVSSFIIKAKAIHKAMLSSLYFKSSADKLALLGTHIDALVAAETGCSTTPPTVSTEERDAWYEKTKAMLRKLRSDVQDAADADPANALVIIASAAMDAKKENTRSRQQNYVVDGIESGSVNLFAEGKGAHEWRMSTDGKIWVTLPATLTAKTIVGGLTVGVEYYFQNRQILPGQQRGEWCDSVKLLVR